MKNIFGKNNPNYKDGRHLIKHYCKDCGQEVCVYSKQCKPCFRKNPPFKKEKKKCIVCGNPLANQYALRCRKCKDKIWRGENHHSWKNLPIPKCIDCGAILSDPRKKRCLVCANTGELNPVWNGGISFEPYPIDWNEKYKRFIRQRDNYKCQLCGVPETECMRKLCVHHIDYNKNNLNPENLVSLCVKCHAKTNTNRKDWEAVWKRLAGYQKLVRSSI